uniref:UPF0313 domain-containing protein n=1 Tax=Fervidobacterium pennivorans TaxID=93466 RepID=A0A832ILA1_FERPE
MFIPITQQELKQRGWDSVDVVLITGDAYVDHPSFAMAVIGRVIEDAGFKVAIIAQPNWKDVNEFKSQLLNEIEVLKARLKVIEEVVGQGQDFLQRLDALDALTIINTFSNLEVLSNRFDQLEARFKKLEDNLSQVVLEQRYILNELVVSQNSVKKFDSLEQKVSQLEASNSANNEDMKKLSAQVESLNSQVMTMRTITYVSLLISIVAGILVLLK